MRLPDGKGGILLIGITNSERPPGWKTTSEISRTGKQLVALSRGSATRSFRPRPGERPPCDNVIPGRRRGSDLPGRRRAFTPSSIPGRQEHPAAVLRTGRRNPAGHTSPSCGELVHRRGSAYVRETRHDRWMSGELTSTSTITGDNPTRELQTSATASSDYVTSIAQPAETFANSGIRA